MKRVSINIATEKTLLPLLEEALTNIQIKLDRHGNIFAARAALVQWQREQCMEDTQHDLAVSVMVSDFLDESADFARARKAELDAEERRLETSIEACKDRASILNVEYEQLRAEPCPGEPGTRPIDHIPVETWAKIFGYLGLDLLRPRVAHTTIDGRTTYKQSKVWSVCKKFTEGWRYIPMKERARLPLIHFVGNWQYSSATVWRRFFNKTGPGMYTRVDDPMRLSELSGALMLPNCQMIHRTKTTGGGLKILMKDNDQPLFGDRALVYNFPVVLSGKKHRVRFSSNVRLLASYGNDWKAKDFAVYMRMERTSIRKNKEPIIAVWYPNTGELANVIPIGTHRVQVIPTSPSVSIVKIKEGDHYVWVQYNRDSPKRRIFASPTKDCCGADLYDKNKKAVLVERRRDDTSGEIVAIVVKLFDLTKLAYAPVFSNLEAPYFEPTKSFELNRENCPRTFVDIRRAKSVQAIENGCMVIENDGYNIIVDLRSGTPIDRSIGGYFDAIFNDGIFFYKLDKHTGRLERFA